MSATRRASASRTMESARKQVKIWATSGAPHLDTHCCSLLADRGELFPVPLWSMRMMLNLGRNSVTHALCFFPQGKPGPPGKHVRRKLLRESPSLALQALTLQVQKPRARGSLLYLPDQPCVYRYGCSPQGSWDCVREAIVQQRNLHHDIFRCRAILPHHAVMASGPWATATCRRHDNYLCLIRLLGGKQSAMNVGFYVVQLKCAEQCGPGHCGSSATIQNARGAYRVIVRCCRAVLHHG